MYARTPPSGTISADRQPWPDDLERMDECYLAVWVATTLEEGREQIIGLVGAALPDPSLAGEVFRDRQGLVQLRRMRVAPEWQRRGVGRRLTQTVIDWATSFGAQALVLETTAQQQAALALYRRMGFQEVARSMHGHYELVWFELGLKGGRATARQTTSPYDAI